MRRKSAALAAAAVMAAGLAGCSSTMDQAMAPAPGPQAPAPVQIPPIAQREHLRLVAAFGGAYHAPELEALVGEVTRKLVAASERPDLSYRVTILNSPAINAFALPSGNLYVTRGLLALANDTAELAGVLAHEMAHVLSNHGAAREDQVKQTRVVAETQTQLLNDPKSGSETVAKGQVTLATFSRAQELEADRIGISIAAKAGYDPYGAARFLISMGRFATVKSLQPGSERQAGQLDFLASHPAAPERVRLAVTAAREISAPGTGIRERDRYLAAISGVIFGDDPKEGIVRGTRFVHPKLGLSFTAPDGFVLENTAQVLLGVAPGNKALRLDKTTLKPGQKFETYIRSGWIDGVEPATVEIKTVNGMKYATAIARGPEWSFRIGLFQVNADVYRVIFGAKHFDDEADQSFKTSLASFARLAPADAQTVKPYRLAIRVTRPGETAEALAGQLPFGDRRLEYFLVLNELEAASDMKTGEAVKIITE